MMRHGLVVMVVLLMVTGLVPAQAQGWLGILSFPLLSERTTEKHAGVNHLITFAKESACESTSGFYKNGFLVLPTDSYGVFDELSWMKVYPEVLGVDPKFIQGVNTAVTGSQGVVATGDRVAFDVGKLTPDIYVIVTDVKQNASRKDRSGILPTIGQLFGIKKHSQTVATDTAAAVFGVVDANRYIQTFCRYQLGCKVEEMTDEHRYLVKSAYFDSRLKGVMEFSEAVADYSWLSQGLALRLQGFKPPMADGQQQEDPAVAAYKQQVEELKRLNELLQTEKSDRDRAETERPQPWSIHAGTSPTGAWTVWIDGSAKSYVAADTITFRTAFGIHWVAIVPSGQPFDKWDKYVVTAAGQQFEEVQ